MDSVEIEDTYGLSLYPKRGLQLERGEGAVLWDVLGNEFIDCISGQGVMNIGHSHPKLVEALECQAKKLMSCPLSFHHSVRAEFLRKLSAVTPERVVKSFLCNSGTEAIEAAIKFSRISTGRTKLLAFMRSFHGRSMGALSVTFNPKYRKPFEPLIPDVSFVPYNNIEKCEEILRERNCAAVVIELVQGEGGVHVADEQFVSHLRKLCDECGTLLIVDEVQTGFGRTGKLFACEHYGLEPDILCLAKAIGGGFPMGAAVVSEKVAKDVAFHGTTFGGNPLACACGIAAMDAIRDDELVKNAALLGTEFLQAMGGFDHESIREVRGRGLLIGVELKVKVQPVLERLTSLGVLALSAGPSVLRLLPPLCISKEQSTLVLKAMNEALGGL